MWQLKEASLSISDFAAWLEVQADERATSGTSSQSGQCVQEHAPHGRREAAGRDGTTVPAASDPCGVLCIRAVRVDRTDAH